MMSFSFTETDYISISYTQAVNKALEKSDAVEDLTGNMEDLWDQRNDMLSVKQQIQEQLDIINRFEKLYDKKYKEGETLTPMESAELAGYQMAFGDKPPTFTNQEMLDQFIKNRDFPHEQLLVAYKELKNTRELIPIQLESSVRSLYVDLLNLREALEGQEKYTDNLKKQYEAAKEKYYFGQISNLALQQAATDYEIQKLTEDKLIRTEKILALNFKKLIGVDLNQNFELTSKMALFNTIELDSMMTYEAQAIKNRLEVLSAKNTYEMEKREANIINEYLSNPLSSDRLSYDSAEIDARNAYSNAILDVKEDITKAYFETEKALENYEIELDEYSKNVNDYKQKREMYNLGMIDKNTFDMIKFSYEMAKNQLLSSRRTLELNYYKLENASNLGPAFEGSTGGAQ